MSKVRLRLEVELRGKLLFLILEDGSANNPASEDSSLIKSRHYTACLFNLPLDVDRFRDELGLQGFRVKKQWR